VLDWGPDRDLKGLTMPHIHTDDDVSIFYRDWGEGDPVVFCAAWALSSIAWEYQMMAVREAGFRAVAFDRRGHGRSDDPGHGYEHERLSQDLATLLDALDLRKVTLVAHSMGSGEAVRYLTRHGSGRVDRLLLLAPTTPYLLQAPDNPQGVPEEFFAERRDEWRRDFGRWILDNETPYFGTGAVSPLLREWTKADMISTSLQAVIEFQRAATRVDFRDELGLIDVPTLVIQGDADASAPLPLTGARSAEMIPGARLVVYEGAPHGLYLTHRERLNEDLLRHHRGEQVEAASAGQLVSAAGEDGQSPQPRGSVASR
jgi:non-heme chloroperoxidase